MYRAPLSIIETDARGLRSCGLRRLQLRRADAAPAIGVLHQHGDHVRTALLPGAIQGHIERLIPTRVRKKPLAVQVDRSVIVHALEMQQAMWPRHIAEGGAIPGVPATTVERVFV